MSRYLLVTRRVKQLIKISCRATNPSGSWREGGLENLKVHKSKLEREKEAWVQVSHMLLTACMHALPDGTVPA